jgi:hypothetical protein
MNLLLDTRILLLAAAEPRKLPADATALISNRDNALYFSAASLWEVVIKNGLGRPDFHVEPHLLRRDLMDNGYLEPGVCTAERRTAATAPPWPLLSAHFRYIEPLCASNDRQNSLKVGRSRVARFLPRRLLAV